jgi:hypothetical protein
MFNGFFLSFRPPLLSGVVTFSFLIYFQQLSVCHMCQEKGFKFFLDIKNNKAHPLDPTCHKHLSVVVYPTLHQITPLKQDVPK